MILRTDSVTGNNRMTKTCDLPVELKGTAWARGLALVAFIFIASLRLDAVAQQQFASPDEAVNALVTAAKAGDTNTLHAIFGPAACKLVSPDFVQATKESEIFLHLYRKTGCYFLKINPPRHWRVNPPHRRRINPYLLTCGGQALRNTTILWPIP